MSKQKDLIPTEHDLQVWKYAQEELFNYLYKGIAGWFQILGHRQIGRWAKLFSDQFVLEVGCGQGHHLIHGRNTYQKYLGLEIRFDFIEKFKKGDSNGIAINGNAFHLPFADQSIDCILSIYMFEHIKDLEINLLEIHRVLKPEGWLLIGLPAEGGFMYKLGRNLTSKPYMEKKFEFNYDAIVKYEHVNDYPQIFKEVKKLFPKTRKIFLPFPFLPSYHLNAVVCLRARKS